jgi:hypothetical protein
LAAPRENQPFAPTPRRHTEIPMKLARSLPLVLLLAAAPAIAQDKHKLRLNFKAGTVVHFLQSQDMDMAMNMGGQDMGTKMQTQMYMTVKIKDVKDGVAELEQEITRVTAKMTNPMMGPIDFDSDVEDSDPGMLEGMANMVKQKMTMKVSSDGKVVGVDLPKELKDMADESGMDLKSMFSQGFTMLPADPIAVGESWKSDIQMPLGQMGETKVDVTNKLLAATAEHATIEQDMKIDLSGMEIPGGMTAEIVKAKGVNKLDLRTGMPADMTMEMEMKFGGADAPMTMVMKMKQAMKQVEAPAPKPAKEQPKKEGDK